MSNIIRTNKIHVICPICKTTDIVGIPPSRLNKKSNLTTISVHKGLICPHHFQFFVDSNFKIRGYQKVDLELNHVNSEKLRNGVKAFKNLNKKNDNLFDNLILDADSVKFISINTKEITKKHELPEELIAKRKKMTSKEIYEEFWEFIDDNNENFHDFIVNDNRRQGSSTNSNLKEYIIA
ncbi:MAG: hypothetical protein ACFE9Z_05045 [Promethearchaeota archaeon]